MGEDKSNSDNENRQHKESAKQDDKQYQKKIVEDITQQFKNSIEGLSLEEPLSGTSTTTDTGNDFNIQTLAEKALSLNVLRFELDRLPLDFKARAYFENDVKPLTDTLTVLSFASHNFSITAINMATTNFGHTSKIKESLDLVEEVNEIAEDLIGVLKCKIDNMLKLAKYDCNCK